MSVIHDIKCDGNCGKQLSAKNPDLGTWLVLKWYDEPMDVRMVTGGIDPDAKWHFCSISCLAAFARIGQNRG